MFWSGILHHGIIAKYSFYFSQNIVAGPAGFLWGWVISSLLILTIGVAMSISGSSISTSGGLYYWTNYYAPPRVKTVLSYLIGNTNSIALVGSFCSVVYGLQFKFMQLSLLLEMEILKLLKLNYTECLWPVSLQK